LFREQVIQALECCRIITGLHMTNRNFPAGPGLLC
jgi:hypothetical protein